MLELMDLLELDGRDVPELAVEPRVVVPPDPPGDRDLDLCAGAPDAVCDQLRLERVDQRFGERVDAPIVVKWRSVAS